MAAICSLGALIPGPSVLTFEYEPTPRAFAVPLLVCAIGLAAQRRYLAAGVAAAIAFLYHPPTALPFWGVYLVLALWPHRERRARLAALIPLAVAGALLLVAARIQSASGEAQRVFARLDNGQEFLQRMRTAYVWISAWPAATIVHHLLVLAVFAAAFVRIRRTAGAELRILLLGLAALGLLTMPLSWCCWSSFIGAWSRRYSPCVRFSFSRSACSFSPPLPAPSRWPRAVPPKPSPGSHSPTCCHCNLCSPDPSSGAASIWRSRWPQSPRWLEFDGRPWLPLAAFLVIPSLGGVVNYPQLHTPDLAELSAWARANTGRDAVFVFPGANRSLAPGIFRSEALRAVYADWKGGGQVNYLKDLGEQWWFRWRQIREFRPGDLPQYTASGISYVVLQEPLPRAAQFQNSTYVVYQIN